MVQIRGPGGPRAQRVRRAPGRPHPARPPQPVRAPIHRAACMPDIPNHCRRAGTRSSLPVTSTGNLWEKDLSRTCWGNSLWSGDCPEYPRQQGSTGAGGHGLRHRRHHRYIRSDRGSGAASTYGWTVSGTPDSRQPHVGAQLGNVHRYLRRSLEDKAGQLFHSQMGVGPGALRRGWIGHVQPDSHVPAVPVSKTRSHLLVPVSKTRSHLLGCG